MRNDPAPFLHPRPAAAKAERVATDTLEVCLNRLGEFEIPLPIPVEQWIEHPLGFEFGVEDLSRFGDGVLGGSLVYERRIVVDTRVASHEGRFRFTVAHELGHMLMHPSLGRVFLESESPQDPRLQHIERQADRFAAAFLMPLPLVMRELFHICDRNRLERRACIVELLCDSPASEWLWRTRFLPAITRRFGVSLSAAVLRFQDVRLRGDRQPFMPHAIARRALKARWQRSPVPEFRIVEGKPVAADGRCESTLF
ncbi:MAG: ImmA/IrrE family metallo-endopeptidase [Phycisphaeraceae bacterium]|nr:ImmA/IrrE family metallo-endopeptidase [Phycisphaeraceae bacterium]